jgi:hypothetical protein
MKKSNAQLIAETRNKLDSVMINEDLRIAAAIASFLGLSAYILNTIINFFTKKPTLDANSLKILNELLENAKSVHEAIKKRNHELFYQTTKTFLKTIQKLPLNDRNLNRNLIINVSEIDIILKALEDKVQLEIDDWITLQQRFEFFITKIRMLLHKDEEPVVPPDIASGLYGA